MKIIATDRAPAAIGPYSQAIAVPLSGELVFCSGQIPIDPATGELVGGSAADQARQVMTNLAAVLEAAGGSLSSIVKTTIFLADMNEFAAVNAVYSEALGPHRPARATVEVSRLPKDVAVEIEAVAIVGSRS